ncbi:molybdenum cofactor guanylyltransferase [Thermaurantiacus sp.]
MRLLGAILAGGQARRFGSDKALARHQGKPLLTHVADALAPQVETVVVVGRSWPGLARIDDRPGPGLGPLGGICGALRHAEVAGYEAVLVAPCDVLGLPPCAAQQLLPPPSVVRKQRLVGLWPSALARPLLDFLLAGESLAVHAFIRLAGFRLVDLPPLVNINRPEDLKRLS